MFHEAIKCVCGSGRIVPGFAGRPSSGAVVPCSMVAALVAAGLAFPLSLIHI